jgi:hypothetical protein
MPEPQPISCGRYSHPIPVLSTKRIPVSTARSSQGGRPPRGFARAGGSKGLIRSHSASGTSGFAMGLSTYPSIGRWAKFCYAFLGGALSACPRSGISSLASVSASGKIVSWVRERASREFGAHALARSGGPAWCRRSLARRRDKAGDAYQAKSPPARVPQER